jgi:hypothetical protein
MVDGVIVLSAAGAGLLEGKGAGPSFRWGDGVLRLWCWGWTRVLRGPSPQPLFLAPQGDAIHGLSPRPEGEGLIF